MSDKKSSPRLTGLRPLSYMGVNATNPPQLVYGKHPPDFSNSEGFSIGSIWMVMNSRKVYMLTGLAGAPADWTQIYPETSETNTFQTDAGVAESDGQGDINFFGGRSMVTEGLHSTLAIRSSNDLLVLGDLSLPLLSAGLIRPDAVGELGNFVDGTDGQLLVSSSSGDPAWYLITSSDNSLTITPGSNTLDIKVTAAGSGYITQLNTENGTATPLANTIRIVGDGTNNSTSGATNVVTDTLANSLNISNSITGAGDISSTGGDIIGNTITSTGLFTAGNGLTITSGNIINDSFTGGVLQSDASGVITSSNGSDGQVLIGGGTNAAWANLTSSDSSVLFVNGANSLDLQAIGGKDRVLGNTGVAFPDVATDTVTVAGGTNVTTAAAGSTVTVDLNNSITIGTSLAVTALSGLVYADSSGVFSATAGTDEQFIVGKTGASHEWKTPVSENATMTINPGSVSGTINFQSTGGGGVGVLDSLSDDSSVKITPVGGIAIIEGGDNLNTVAAGNVLTVNLDKSIYQPTSTHFFGEAYPEGYYLLDGKRFLHNFAWSYSGGGSPVWSQGQACTYVGSETGFNDAAGSVPYIPEYNTGIGAAAIKSQYPGKYNSGLGVNTLYNAGSLYENIIGVGIGLQPQGSTISFHPYYSEAYYPNQIKIGEQPPHGATPTSTQCNRCHIAGIWNGGLLDVTHREPVLVDQYGYVSSDTDGATHVTTDGDLLIGSDPYGGMQRGKITATSGEITVVNGPHSIDFADSGVACFSAYQSSTVNNVTGDGTRYSLGSSAVLNEYFDDGGNFYIGDGSGNAAYFTAPVEGSYFFTIAITLDNINTSASYGDQISIDTYIDDALNWSAVDFVNPVTEGLGQQSILASGESYLLPGDKVYFRILVNISGVGKTVGIASGTTNVSGFLINSR